MIEKLIRFFYGYVRISIKNGQIERFLNLCKSKRISMEKIRCTGETETTAILSLQDFFALRPIRSKTKVHIHVQKKHGLPFFFYRNKKRKAFFLGILLCFFLLTFFSNRIWNIHVEGNVKNTTPEILEFLEGEGVLHGMAKRKVNCGEIAAMVRKKYPEITWVSARIEGTRLLLTIQEGIMLQQTSLETRPCNLEAQQEGTIVEMITRKGVPLFKPGDTCKKGDILVSGELPIQNDSQEIVRYEYVHADADVYVKHKLAYYQEFLRSYETMVPTTHKKKGFFLKIAGFYLGVYPKTDKTWRCAGSEYSLHLTENFCLPFSVGTFVFTEYETVKATYTREEAERTAVSRLHSYEEQLLKQGIKIAENRVSVTVNDTACISKGYLTVLERTGKETAIKEQTPPIRNDRPRPEP